MSDVGPPTWVVVGTMAGAFLAASLLAVGAAHLLYRALAPHGETRVRGAFIAVGVVLVAVAAGLMTMSDGSAYAEEGAFWTAVPGVALVGRGLVRRRAR